MKRAALGIVLAGMILVAPASGLGATHTTATIFEPFTATGATAVPTKPKSGHCFTGSLAVNRSDAWRCLAGNLLFDPCFSASDHPGVVVCPNRSVNGGVKLRLTKKLPQGSADPGSASLKNRPWTIQLTNGRHCAFSSGASRAIHRVRLNYFCGPHSKKGLWGRPDRQSQPWTIRIAPLTAKRLHRRAAIRHAWM